MNYSLFVGIEQFLDTKIPPVGHAAADAESMAEAFKEFGFDEKYREVLINGQATLANVGYTLEQILKSAQKNDAVVVSFSTHGCCADGKNYLVCHDTRHGGYAGTGLSIHKIFQLLTDTKSEKVMLFLDCCHAALPFPEGEKGTLANLTDSEIQQFFAGSAYRVAFASCADNEKSYWSDVLGHGVWTYVLLEALRGNAPQILQNGRYLRAAQLQDYLFEQVPIKLRDTSRERRVQTPKIFGSMTNSFLVADLEPVLRKRIKGIEEIGPIVKSASFIDLRERNISELPGFLRGVHKVSGKYDNFTQNFVARICKPQIEQRSEELFQRIKAAFGYLRTDARRDVDQQAATIRAKDFDVDIQIYQSEDNPSCYIEELEVSNFQSSDTFMGEAFNKVFTGLVSTLRIKFGTKRSIQEFIDQVERAQDSNIDIEYPSDTSYCKFRIEGVDASFFLRPDRLDVELFRKSPKELVRMLVEGGKAALMDSAAVSLLPPKPASLAVQVLPTSPAKQASAEPVADAETGQGA